MTIEFTTLTVKNFMSVGAATQVIDFNRQDLTLVLGENLDLGGDGSRNGTGKTTAINALSYALFGQAISNIKRDNLINKTNGKNMLVTLDFSVNNQQYRIERGRRPHLLRFFIDNQEQAIQNDAQGENRETQQAIEQLINLTPDMFKHIVALNTYTEPFLSLRTNDQRTIIEQLLGITQLSERAERLKDQVRITKTQITEEEYRIKAVTEANKRIQEQIDSLQKRHKLWQAKQQQDVSEYQKAIADLSHVDIDKEIAAHKTLEIWSAKTATVKEAKRWIEKIKQEQNKLENLESKLKTEISALETHVCYACGQDLHDEKQDEILTAKRNLLQETALQWMANNTQQLEHEQTIRDTGDVGKQPDVFYDTLEKALGHRHTVEALQSALATRAAEQDPYLEQIDEMKEKAIETVDYTELNNLTRVQEHQDFLIKLLTNKDSFLRKKIIDQNLTYLNSRLTHYLDQIGLPHTVKFLNDLSVEIEELGRDLDFDNLSRGERNRLILSMSWAFRDVYESLYHPINLLFVDEMIDSGLDTQGVENALALLKNMSRERNKSVWLVSHRDELVGRVENILKVIKTNGFTEFSTS